MERLSNVLMTEWRENGGIYALLFKRCHRNVLQGKLDT
jgi:hypothetical protein